MDLLKTFVFDNTTHRVTVKVIDEKTFFLATDIGRILGIQRTRNSVKDFDEDEKDIHVVDTSGGQQETIFLTDIGVYRLLMRSNKPIARPFQKWVVQVIKSVQDTGKYDLQKEIEDMKRGYEEKLSDERMLRIKYNDGQDEKTHKKIVAGYADKPLVYFGKIKTLEDDRVLVKIGCTRSIRERVNGLINEFGGMAIFRVFECDRHEEFEKFLHQHVDIRRYTYSDKINDKKRSSEVFMMTKEELVRAENIAQRNLGQFRRNNKRDIDEVIGSHEIIRELCEKVGVSMTDQQEPEEVGYTNKRGRCTLEGPKIQRYSEDGEEHVQTYDCMMDAVRDVHTNIKKPTIERAIRSNCIEDGQRWAYLDRSLPDDTVQDIGETVVIGARRSPG